MTRWHYKVVSRYDDDGYYGDRELTDELFEGWQIGGVVRIEHARRTDFHLQRPVNE